MKSTLPLSMSFFIFILAAAICPGATGVSPSADELTLAKRFVEVKFEAENPRNPGLIVELNNGPIELNSYWKQPLQLGDKQFAKGIGCHAPSKITVCLPGPGKKFLAQVGLDNNEDTRRGNGSVVFSVNVGGRELFHSGVCRLDAPAQAVDVDLNGARQLTLQVGDAGDGIGWDQAAWADARIELADGKIVPLGDLPILADAEGLFSTDPPFSFTYGGKPSAEFLPSWKVTRETRKIDEHRTGHTVTYADPAGGLVVRCEAVAYDDFPTVEWTLYFKNPGKADTPMIEDIQALDVRWERGASPEYLLHHNVGAPSTGRDYTPLETVLAGNGTKRIAAAGGRSTNSDLSYFNLQRGNDDGLIVVVGWPGQWAADFIRDGGQGIRLRAGQELTHFKLHPEEEVRSPLIVLQFWRGGDWIRAQNVWRRWMIAHNIPRPGGKLPAPQLLAYSGGAYEETYKATEENQKMWIDRYLEERIPLDYWWMDAGWYKCRDGWWNVGTWEVDTKRFPRGLKAVTDHAHAKGLRTLLWFEPERVAAGTWLAENKPEWVLGGNKGGLLNLGNPEVLEWITERVDKVLTEEGIDLYRQDFNMDPLSFWRAADAPDRQGITEIQHVTNLLKFWDELRRRHPNMLIDECASGGRRNDLEMMRRAVPMWRSDRTMEPIGQQSMTYGIAQWIPFFGTGTLAWGDAKYFETGVTPVQAYGFWSSACPSLNLLFDVREKGLDYDKIRKLTSQWREVMPNYYGDFYPLTRCTHDNDDWIAWQFDRPEQGAGVVQAFRRAGSIYESARLKLRGLDPQARYRFTRFDPPEQFERNGKELLENGLSVAIEKRPGTAVLLYRRVD
ncbi:MAG: alpha-galactosidase [Pirellulales bacterium]|nr:alpha-galactosidase [Pirellulales bacterium]